MSHKHTAKLFAAALACAAIPAALVTDSKPATAQVSLTVSFDYFHRTLSPYGRWFYHPRWGDVWHPTVADFRPYYRRGHWAYTDAGWMWVSDYRWGDIAFHYGRWVYDPQYGWLWVPGYVWAPAWVIWREGDGDVGWCPMPPDEAWLAGQEVWPTAWNNSDRAYGYMDWYGPNYGPNWLAASAWVFVPQAHFADRNYTSYAADSRQAQRLFGTTRDVTNYANVNGYVANRSIDPAAIGRASGRTYTATQARNVLGARAPIDPISTGQRVHTAELSRHGGDPRAAANAQAVPLNAAAAARGGRATFGNRAAAAAPNAPPTERGPAQFAAGPRGQGAAGRAPRSQEQQTHFAGRAETAPHGPAAAVGGPHGRFGGGGRQGPAPQTVQAGPPPGFGGGGPHGRFGGGGPQGPAPQTARGGPPPGFGGGGPHGRFGGGGPQGPAPQTAQGGPPPGFGGGGPHGRFGGGGPQGPAPQTVQGGPPPGFRGGGPHGRFGGGGPQGPAPQTAQGGPPPGFGGGGPHGRFGGGGPQGPAPQTAQGGPPPGGGGGGPHGGGGGGHGHGHG
ncbi:MAG TPA: DUF6600 domain-containing protein [Micropepsaceae bacterium]|nr:DUF6600 domain-containing protein [Micropepsaceae bacterium]